MTVLRMLLLKKLVNWQLRIFALSRVRRFRPVGAAAAGGCILMETPLLEQIGGFKSIKSAVIDDCALAGRVKSQGLKIWLGLTHSVKSVREYNNLKEMWDM